MNTENAGTKVKAAEVAVKQGRLGDGLNRTALSPTMLGTSWALRILAAVVLGQTLFFKFTGAPEAVYIFSTLGVEPWGRIAAGVSELIAVVLLLWPRMAVAGAAMSAGIMAGAIASHLGPLGIAVKGDGGLLFALALVVLAAAVGVMLIGKQDVRQMLRSPGSFLIGRGV